MTHAYWAKRMKPILAVVGDVNIPRAKIQGACSYTIKNPVHRWSTSPPYSKILRVFCLLGFSPLCSASAVAIWLNTESIVVAADSLESQEIGATTNGAMVCKIQPIGRLYMAATGTPSVNVAGRPTEVLFSAVGIARSLVSAITDDIRALLPNFIREAEPRFQEIMTSRLRDNPDRFMRDIDGKGGALSVAIFGVTQDGPAIGKVGFIATATSSGVRVTHSEPQYCPGECNLVGGVIARLGSQYVESTEIPTTEERAMSWAASTIESEIAADEGRSRRDNKSRIVGGPISMLILSRSVTRWPEGYHETCPEQ
jgi:hypothetical protein